MEPGDFRDRRSFPGLEGGTFEILVRLGERLERLPRGLFAPILLAVAYLAAGTLPARAILLGAFCLFDWLLLLALPRFRLSDGPANGPALLLAILRAPFAWLPNPWSLFLQVGGTVLLAYGFAIEPNWVQLSHQRLRTPRWRGERSLRLLHFGDLHLESVSHRERSLVDIAGDAGPDLILISGDFLSYSNVGDRRAWELVRGVLQQLSAPLGVFAVSGTPLVDPVDVLPELFRGTPVRWLRDERITLRQGSEDFAVIGLSCTHKPFLDSARLAELVPHPGERLTILLYHTPDLAPDAARLGVDLQLSGHTHGGQVRLPWIGALYPSSLYGKRFEVGRHQLGGMTLYVTRGLGMEGKGAPRVRFLCRPEITLWEISRPGSPDARRKAG
jgi:hypothetical protein